MWKGIGCQGAQVGDLQKPPRRCWTVGVSLWGLAQFPTWANGHAGWRAQHATLPCPLPLGLTSFQAPSQTNNLCVLQLGLPGDGQEDILQGGQPQLQVRHTQLQLVDLGDGMSDWWW